MRYRGQSYEVSVPVPKLRSVADVSALMRRYHEAHRRRYGHMAQNEAIEVVNFQVTAIGMMRKPQSKKFKIAATRRPSPREVRPLYFGTGRAVQTPVYRRDALVPGVRLTGPAVIEEKTSTIVVYPKQIAQIDEYLNVEITFERSRLR
jgi:N-methylhydantoinase A